MALETFAWFVARIVVSYLDITQTTSIQIQACVFAKKTRSIAVDLVAL
jgi:hypothetical protein